MAQERHVSLKETTLEQKQQRQNIFGYMKKQVFEIMFTHLRENINVSPYPYYLLIIIQQMALLWYLVHPALKIYDNAKFINQVRIILKSLNFHQYLADNSDLYLPIFLGVFMFVAIEFTIFSISAIGILKGRQGKFFKYLRKIANFVFITTAKVLSGPILALCINILYCGRNIYHYNQVCYDLPYTIICVLAVIVTVIIVIQILILSLVYYVKNPVCDSYMGAINRYQILSKFLLKIMFPLYFALDQNFSYISVYLYSCAIILGGYLLLHRFNSIHTYNPSHFYFQYWNEMLLFWIAVSNIMYYYFFINSVQHSFSFLYAIFLGGLMAWFMCIVQKQLQDQFVKASAQSKCRKQDVERLLVALVGKFIHKEENASNLQFKIFSKCFLSHKINYMPNMKDKDLNISKTMYRENQYYKNNLDISKEIFLFFYSFLQEYLKLNKSFLLKNMQIQLLSVLGKKSKAIHKSLELSKQKLSLIQQFALHQFFGTQIMQIQTGVNKVNQQFIHFCKYNRQIEQLQSLIQQCSINIQEYWEELVQLEPSIPKIRSLATQCQILQDSINREYVKVEQLMPQSYLATRLYLDFLFEIGINVRECIKMRQKLKIIFQSSLGQSQQFQSSKFNKNASIITVGSVGNELGLIINSNSQILDLLGYERVAIIGKSVTKLMPLIYAGLHDKFMLNFIDNEDSHLNLSEKFVTALGNNSLLVQSKLLVKLMYSQSDGLQFVGVMQKQKQFQGKGLIMYETKTNLILCINQNFVNLMNGKITGKQVIHQQVRLTLLLPNLIIKNLNKQEIINTDLQVGILNDADDEQSSIHKKIVSVQLKYTKMYEGVQLGFISIQQFKLININDSRSFEPGVAIGKNRRRSRPKLTYQLNNFAPSFVIANSGLQGKDQLQKQLSTTRQLEQFIKNKDPSNLKWMVRAITLFIIIIFSILIILFYFQHYSYLQSQNRNYQQLNQTLSLTKYQAMINLMVAKIWNISTADFNDAVNSTFFDQLNYNVDKISTTYFSIMSTLSKYSTDLQFNQANTANRIPFTFSLLNNNKIKSSMMNTSISYGMVLYIASCSKFATTGISYNPQDLLQLQLSALQIQANGQDIIPSLVDVAADKYYQYISQQNKNQFYYFQVKKVVALSGLVIFLGVVAWIGDRLRKSNKVIINIVNTIKLQDIHQMLKKCNSFLSKQKLKVIKKPRIQSLQKKFSKNIVVQILLQDHQNKKIVQTQNNQEKFLYKNNERIISKSNQKNNLRRDEIIDTNQPFMTNETEPQENLFQQNPQQQTVKLVWTYSRKSVILIVIFMVFTMGITLTVFNLIGKQYQTNLNGNFYQLTSLGEMQKVLPYLDYFAYRIITNSSDQEAKNLMNQNIKVFFQNSALNYQTLSSPYPVLKQVYPIVQTLNQLISAPRGSTSREFLPNYTMISAGLTNGFNNMIQLGQNVIYPQFGKLLQNSQSTQLIWMLLMIAIIWIFLGGLWAWYLHPITLQNQRSLNMLRMLPSWLVERNEKTMEMITRPSIRFLM